jgi:hypothetical protein
MTTLEALIRLRDDLKEWVANNLNAIGKPKASDVSIDAIEGMSASTAQDAIEVLKTNKLEIVNRESASSAQTAFADYLQVVEKMKLYDVLMIKGKVNNQFSITFVYKWGDDNSYVGYMLNGYSIFYNNRYSATDHVTQLISTT